MLGGCGIANHHGIGARLWNRMRTYGESDETAVYSFNDCYRRLRPDRASRPCQEGGHRARQVRGARQEGRAHARSAPGALLDHQYDNEYYHGAVVREGGAALVL